MMSVLPSSLSLFSQCLERTHTHKHTVFAKEEMNPFPPSSRKQKKKGNNNSNNNHYNEINFFLLFRRTSVVLLDLYISVRLFLPTVLLHAVMFSGCRFFFPVFFILTITWSEQCHFSFCFDNRSLLAPFHPRLKSTKRIIVVNILSFQNYSSF